MKKNIKWSKWENEPVKNQDWEDDEDSYQPFIRTQYGNLTIKLSTNNNESLNWWVGHTNFDIGVREKNKICDVPGVEIFDLFSPYRFRICIGEAFDTEKVKESVLSRFNKEKKLIGENTLECINNMKKTLSKQSKYWLVFVLPNEKVEGFVCNDKDDYDKTKSRLDIAQMSLGGKVYSGV